MPGPVPVAHAPDDVTVDWLEAALGRRVGSLERSEAASVWGTHLRLVVHVDGEATPLRLRVKIGSATVFGRAEVDYYVRDFVGLVDAPLVRCHHADADATHYHVVMDDLELTHRNQDDVPVTEGYARGLAESLARMHAHRWAQPPPDAAGLDGALAEARAGLPVMLAAMAERFSAAERDVVREVFAWLPDALQARARDPLGYAWVHGDLNPGNILAPRRGDGPVLLLDHQPFGGVAASGLAVSDLTYAVVLWWPEEARRAWGPTALSHWHAALGARGTSYPLERARADWALCVAAMLVVPASRCSEPEALTTMRWLWEMFTRRTLLALAELAGG